MCTNLYKKTQKLLCYMHWNKMYTQSRICFPPQKESTCQKSGKHTSMPQVALVLQGFSPYHNLGPEGSLHTSDSCRATEKRSNCYCNFLSYHSEDTLLLIFLATEVIKVRIRKPVISLNFPR